MSEIQSELKDQKDQIVFPLDLTASPRAICIHCSDPRFQKAFQMFIEGSCEQGCLGYAPGEYVTIVIPGSIASLSEVTALPKHFKITKEQIEYLLERFNTIETLVLINHEDCSGYRAIKKKASGILQSLIEVLTKSQLMDLQQVAKTLLNLNSIKKKIRLFMAKKENGHVIFEEYQVN
ncbi:MAG: hypothetical protein COX77_02580 [Candidatus Komeilibacteria bacterium CG_4_10_14_0_2_um_filter_37_10]|uniref:Carbonic anhydrase n=1 Tax=Candidatus Komeilibacteria bacterium CG_4_10_14_0_2_um_filter_37_10 TaxID=1974470 RepID=A0A2M7VEW6_9BACT|nr:MAG: hypothetical protein COX77_02580 [Candidatus Komeilibacteria bacterium CG_4_10_14_0_2_um_filter_37_10]